jgi:hypothetical protein
MFKVHAIDEHIRSAYGMTVSDMNGNGHKDILVGSTGISMIAIYEGPTFKKRIVSESHPGTIGLAAHDLTGNGHKDILAASGFGRKQRNIQEYLHWFEASDDGQSWTQHFIEWMPYLHRIALVHVDGQPLLIAATLQGAGSGFNEFDAPGALWCFRISGNSDAPWEKRLIDGHLRLNHGLSVCDVDNDGRPDLLIGAREELIWYEPPKSDPFTGTWEKHIISDRESSETFAIDLDGDGINEILSIEPWHGNELAWYKATGDLRSDAWERHQIDDTLNHGHSLWGGDIDNDGAVEIISGYNGPGTQLNVYHPQNLDQNTWQREKIDDGLGMGQMEVTDLNNNGRLDIAATGMSTGNVRWYENMR